jgi:Flavin containing amine oxidoreductase
VSPSRSSFCISDAISQGLSGTCRNEDASKIVGTVWRLFVNIDGAEGKKVCPLPYAQTGNPWVDCEVIKKVDAYSCWDRYLEIKDQLNEEEQGVLIATIINLTGGKPDMENSGYWDIIRSHPINSHTYDLMGEIWITYKMSDGSSHLTRQMFDEAIDYGLEYTFKTNVERIAQTSTGNGIFQIHTRDGRVFKSRKAIGTAPLNTLKSIVFEPPFEKLRQEAVDAGHISFMTKAHVIIIGPDMASWAGACYPGPLNMAFGDGLTPDGDAHLTSFGCDYRDEFVLEEHPEKLAEAFQQFHPTEVKKIVSQYPVASWISTNC